MTVVIVAADELTAIRRHWPGQGRATAIGVWTVLSQAAIDGPAAIEEVATASGLRAPTVRRYLVAFSELGLVVLKRGYCFPRALR